MLKLYRYPIALSLALVMSLHIPSQGHAEQADSAQADKKTKEAETAKLNAESSAEVAKETAAEVNRLKQQANEAEQLTSEAKAEIVELCDKAAAKLDDATKLEASTIKLQQELETAATTLEALQSKEPQVDSPGVSLKGMSSEEMRSRLSTADKNVSAAREQLQKTTVEIQRRAERRKVLPELLAKSREQLMSILELQKQPDDAQHLLLSEARKAYSTARRLFREKELKWLEQENRTYEATSRLWLARRDDAEKKLRVITEQHAAIEKAVAEMQRQVAQQQAIEARRLAINAHPAIKKAAAVNAELAERNQKIVARTQAIQQKLAEANELILDIKGRLEDVAQRADAGKYSPAIGIMLRSEQDQLPALGPYRQRLQSRPGEVSQLGLDIYEWESQRRDALQVEKSIEAAKQAFEVTVEGAMQEEVSTELRRVLEARANILAELYSNANDCLVRLSDLDASETEVISKTEELAAFIAEHVLWVRSAPSLSLGELKQVASSWRDWEDIVERTRAVPSSLLSDLKQHSALWGLAAFLLLALVLGRKRIRNDLKESGEAAAKPTATLFRPTVDASVATILLAIPIPLFLGFIGWRLCQSNVGLPHAAGWALVLFSSVYAMLDLVRHASRYGGLGTNHFGWDQKGLKAIRHSTRSLQLLALPLLAVAGGIEVTHGEGLLNTVGRLSLIAALLVIGAVCFRLFRANGRFVSSLATNAKSWGNARTIMKVILPLSLAAVVGLIVASAVGYHFTAMQLTRRVFVSCVFVFACFALRSLLMRWLLVAYRRVAMIQAREKRQARLDAQESGSSDATVVESDPQFNLSNINQQARKLVGVGAAIAFLASMWFIWNDILPALGVFNHIHLWPSGLVPLDPDAGPDQITPADLLFAFGIFGLTWFAGSNLPGLLEISILQKLPLDAGARYAASSVTRYTIVVVGTAFCMRQIGVGWQSVQWLVAAMTVGLGFGLQEIFANFVSGIILLFERPARVGDTVTVGDITGTVTKIRIRATTILDWDNKELIVPNKEFVTGNLVNWTLSTPNLRLVIHVGVAYGSNTRLATELLYKVAAENPKVLNTPEPSVVFNEFGDSSLNFELRLFVSDLNLYRSLRHDLHLAIDDSFRQNNIEIAFPQCDLHVKSLPAAGQNKLSAHQPVETHDVDDIAA